MIQAPPSFQVACPSCRTEFPVDPEKVPPGGVHAICSECQRVFQVEVPEELLASVAVEALDDTVADEQEAPLVPEDDIEDVTDVDVTSGAEVATDFEPEAEEAAPVPDAEDEAVAPEASAEVDLEEAPDADVDASPVPDVERVVEPEPGVDVEVEDTPLEEAEAEPTAAKPESPAVEEATDEPDEVDALFEDLTTLTSEAMADEDLDEQLATSALSLAADRFGKRDPGERARRLARVLVSDIIAYYPARYRESLARGTVKDDFEDEVKKSWKEYVDQVGLEVAESTPHFEDALNEILGKGEKIF